MKKCTFDENSLCRYRMQGKCFKKQNCPYSEGVQTNREWMESLSDEELASELADFATVYHTPDAIKDWLQAEHKED